MFIRLALGLIAIAWVAAGPASGQALYYTGYQTAPSSGSALHAGTPPVGSGPALGSGSFLANDASSGSAPKRISRRKAIGASLLIPGWGQWLTGRPGRAKAFFVAEIGIAVTYAVFGIQGKVRKNRYIDYAEQFAGVEDAGGKEDTYYRDLGVYTNTDDYLEFVQRTARALYGDDLESRDAYVARYAPSPSESWEWASEAHRLEYREQRKSSRNSYRRASHMLGVALLNRVVSAIDAAFAAGSPSPKQTVYLDTAEDGTSYVGVHLELD